MSKKPKQFVVLSDLHAHPWSAFAEGEGESNSRLLQTMQVLRAALDRAAKDEIPFLFAGDLVHTAGYALNVVMSLLVDEFLRHPDVIKAAIWGNHDARGKGGKITGEQTALWALRKAVPNFHMLDPSRGLTDTLEVDGVTISGAGYQPRGDLLTLPEKADIGLFHQTIRGSSTAHGHTLEEGIERDRLLDCCRVAIVGHVHHPQTFPAPDGQAILVPGSPEHHNFGDKGDHGWWVLSLPEQETQDPEVEFVPGGSPQFLTVETADAIAKDDGNFYRVKKVRAGEDPARDSGAAVIGPEPTTVEARDLLKGVTTVEELLQVWMTEYPPEGGDDASAGNDEYLRVGRQLLEAQERIRLRPVRLESVRVRNFCSYEDETLTVTPGLFLITGEGSNYPSNGAGKTTLFGEAAYYLIHGQTTKKQSVNDVVRWGEDEMAVSGTLRDLKTGDLLHIERGRSKGSPFMTVSDEKKGDWEAKSVDEMTSKLQAYLGLTSTMHQMLGYVSQEGVVYFASSTDGERKEVLADLIGASSYKSAASAAGSASEEQSRKADTLAERRDEQQGQVKEWADTLAQTEEKADEWEALHREKIEQAEQKLNTLEEDTSTRELSTRGEALQDRIDQAEDQGRARIESQRAALEEAEIAKASQREQDRQEKLQQKLEEQQQKIEAEWATLENAQEAAGDLPQLHEKHELTEALLQEHRQTLSDKEREASQVKTQASSTEAVAQSIKERLKEALDRFDQGVCPTCGQEVDSAHIQEQVGGFQQRAITKAQEAVELREKATDLQAEVTQLSRRVNALEAKVQEQAGEIKKLEDLFADLTRLEKLTDEVAESSAALSDLQGEAQDRVAKKLQAQKDRCSQIHNRYRKRVSHYVAREIQAHEKAVQEARAAVEELQEEENPLSPLLEDYNERHEKAVARMKQLEEDLHEARKLKDIYAYWKHGFGKQGVQSLLLEEVASLFNEHRGSIFPLISEGVFDVQFSTISTTRAGELRERTDFIIRKEGREVPYNSLSGGERRRVDLGIMITLTRSVSEWMQVPGVLGVLVLDEVFGFLDPSGAEGLLSALQDMNETIHTIYAVTHDEKLQSLFPEVLHVQQDDDGISRLAS